MTDLQLYLAIGLPVLAILLSAIGNMVQINALSSNVNARFASLESTMNSRFSTLESRFSSLESRFDTLTGKVVEVDNRLTRLEAIIERR